MKARFEEEKQQQEKKKNPKPKKQHLSGSVYGWVGTCVVDDTSSLEEEENEWHRN